MAIATTRSFSRGILARYGSLALASGIFFVAIFFLFQTLFKQKDLIERQSRVNIWFLAQTEIEYLNFIETLDLFSLGEERITKDALIDRFEIFWSRLPVLLKGQQSEQLRLVDGLVETATALVRKMEELEPALNKVRREDTKELADIRNTLASLHEPLREMVRSALLFDNTTLAAERQSHEDIYYQLLGLFIAVLAAGAVLFILLHRQILKTQQLVAHAKQAEQAAQTARSELVLAIESISEGFIIYDQEERVALFNERYKELHPPIAELITVGVRFEDLLRMAVARGGVKVPPDQVEAWIQNALQSHRAPSAIFESKISDGRYLKISERRTGDGRIVGVHTDVTELKRREIELTQKSTLLQTTFDGIDQGIAVFGPDRRLQTCNQLFIEMHDLPPHLVESGRAYSEIVAYNAEHGQYGEGKAEDHIERQLRILDDIFGPYGGQKRIERRRPNGTAIETRYIALPDGSFVKIYSDITERVNAEEERGRLREQFHASQKMQAIGTLAGGIAHDFNNILGSILGNCFLLLEDLPEKNDIHERLQQVMKAGNRAKALVQQILTYSRHAEFILKPLAVDAAIKESIELIRSSLPRNVNLISEEIEKTYVAADATQLHQVVLNLCVNAMQAVGERKGTITVSLTTLDNEGAVTPVVTFNGKMNKPSFGPTELGDGWARMWVGVLNPGRYCRITVADTGCGMDRPTMMRIFEPFFTTKEVGTGTGLGLAAVHGILRNHNGVVAVSSCVGKGSVFDVYLPVCGEADAALEERVEVVEIAGHERILLVDDDRALLDITQTLLARRGYDVSSFSSPEEALAAFRRAPDNWDIVLTDRSMPTLSGEDLAYQILQLRPDMPVIMATGFGEATDEERARQIGIVEFIFKPITGTDLLVAIRRALAKTKANAPLLARRISGP
jgi:signal transduction histidine kinase/ActR/RegA family two-component response regulator